MTKISYRKIQDRALIAFDAGKRIGNIYFNTGIPTVQFLFGRETGISLVCTTIKEAKDRLSSQYELSLLR